MKVYRIDSDVNEYQWIMPHNEKDLFGALSFDCISKKREWNPLEMYVFNPKKKKGNFYSLGGIGALAFDKYVLDIMLSVFEMAGEILPIKLNGDTLYILNVLECVNMLDDKKTKWDYYENGDKGRILNYSFYINRFPESSILKIPETSKVDVLTYSEVKDSQDEFYYLYKHHNLTGLVFEEVYKS